MPDEKKSIGIEKIVTSDEEVKVYWNRLNDKEKQYFLDVDRGIIVPDMLSDTMFKGIFDPRLGGEWLSKLISAILGFKVKVVRSLDKEGFRHSMNSKGVFLDILVELEDGTYANVEIQRKGIEMPPERSALYSAEILTGQFATYYGQKKSEIDYEDIHRVYSIIIIENSAGPFAESNSYHHHFQQKSDTGLDIELLQYYDYICLDKFRQSKPHIANELCSWLEFLTIREVSVMRGFLEKNPSFRTVYDRAIMMMADKEGLMSIVAEILANEDIFASIKKTNESKIARYQRQIAEYERKEAEYERKEAEYEHEKAELKKEIAELKQKLNMNS